MSQFIADYYDNPDLQEQARVSLAGVKAFLAQERISDEEPLLDLGCGNGALAIGLAQAGWSVTGIDFSDAMIAVANERAKANGVSPSFQVADLQLFQPKKPVKVAICYDVLNHFLSDTEILTVFRRVYQGLRPGGFFLFDLNTRENYASPIWTYENRELEGPNYKMTLNGHFASDTGRVTVTTHVELQTDTGPQVLENELHCQYYPEPQIGALLKQVGFTEIAYSSFSPVDLTDRVPGLTATKTRWHCQKPQR